MDKAEVDTQNKPCYFIWNPLRVKYQKCKNHPYVEGAKYGKMIKKMCLYKKD